MATCTTCQLEPMHIMDKSPNISFRTQILLLNYLSQFIKILKSGANLNLPVKRYRRRFSFHSFDHKDGSSKALFPRIKFNKKYSLQGREQTVQISKDLKLYNLYSMSEF